MIDRNKLPLFDGWRAIAYDEVIKERDAVFVIDDPKHPSHCTKARSSIGLTIGTYGPFSGGFHWIYRRESNGATRRLAMNPAFSKELPLP